ncbi:MAG: rhodanese-like domain-containing protein [Ignavibacteriae bacterium]|nr:rhodanese-like domain-containing protein [Ignavibacteriota bacterium]MCB0724712.1 rhodanese-like domain-containing protein [Ignavibacteriota bacterium]MCB9242275.1 rhodanese-like domain-containing protein [Ignavibacteriales bacterium]
MKHEHIKIDEFKTKMDEGGYQVLDLRTPAEFEAGHIEGSYNLDFTHPGFHALIEALDKDKKYLLYCRTGNKSGQTMDIMKEKGFAESYNMLGGIVEWNDEGYDVVK